MSFLTNSATVWMPAPKECMKCSEGGWTGHYLHKQTKKRRRGRRRSTLAVLKNVTLTSLSVWTVNIWQKVHFNHNEQVGSHLYGCCLIHYLCKYWCTETFTALKTDSLQLCFAYCVLARGASLSVKCFLFGWVSCYVYNSPMLSQQEGTEVKETPPPSGGYNWWCSCNLTTSMTGTKRGRCSFKFQYLNLFSAQTEPAQRNLIRFKYSMIELLKLFCYLCSNHLT